MKQVFISPKRFALSAVGLVIIIVIMASAYYFYNQYQKSQELLKNPSLASTEEIKTLKEKIGKLIDLPSGEEPTVATVSDKNKLKDQPFFQKAENGDKVLIYSQAKKAYLYRPSTNKVIEVAPISLATSPPPEATASAQIQQSIKVALYNGTKANGLASKVESDLKKSSPFVSVVKKDNSKGEFDKTMIVVLNDSFKDAASSLAKTLNAQISSLPAGENKPAGADILIILGKDRT